MCPSAQPGNAVAANLAQALRQLLQQHPHGPSQTAVQCPATTRLTRIGLKGLSQDTCCLMPPTAKATTSFNRSAGSL